LPNTPIYWEGGPTALWFLLQRPSYISCDSGTGTLFDRQTAIVFQKRFKSIAALNTADNIFVEICPPAQNTDQHQVTAASLASVCREQPALGAMVLLHDIADAPHKTWTAPVPFGYVYGASKAPKLIQTDKFYIYNCADLR
jgi:thioester reductase-like protein